VDVGVESGEFGVEFARELQEVDDGLVEPLTGDKQPDSAPWSNQHKVTDLTIDRKILYVVTMPFQYLLDHRG
jgi:hypothetical protein